MAINTKTVTGRRHLAFASLEDVVADAQKLAADPSAKVLGNWPLGQLCTHLATTINHSIDGIPFKAPWFIRMLGPLFKRRFLTRTMSPGFRLPAAAEAGFFPPVVSALEGAEQLRAAVARTQKEKMAAAHPVLGKLTHEEWNMLHLRHAELHLSFAVPA